MILTAFIAALWLISAWLTADRDRVRAALARATSGMRPAVDISPILVERFGQTMRAKLTTGEVSFRKAYLGSIVDRVEVDDHEIPHRRPQGRAGAGGSGERRSRARGSQFCLQMARRTG